jgi:hypothetical protein
MITRLFFLELLTIISIRNHPPFPATSTGRICNCLGSFFSLLRFSRC